MSSDFVQRRTCSQRILLKCKMSGKSRIDGDPIVYRTDGDAGTPGGAARSEVVMRT